MIWESAPWKKSLKQDAARLKRLSASALRDSNLVKVEQTVFSAAYAIRKLSEAHKVSDDARRTKLPVLRFSRMKNSRLSFWNWHHIERHFDMGRPRASHVDVLFLCNQLIHSYVFLVVTPRPKCVEAFLVTSDREKERGLLQVSIDDFVTCLLRFADDSPSGLAWSHQDGVEIIEVTP